tara:strand:+ start:696 stop:968 length:273 start_codon:yes stop_codon:yes gene_type:complete
VKVELKELDVSTIITALPSLSFEDLDRINEEVKYHKSKKFKIGAQVSFVQRRNGVRLYGVIHKINPKTIGIDTENEGRWKVSTSLVRLER